jgi:hypothetical protein
MSWIKGFFLSWFCLLYFFLFAQFSFLSFLIVRDNSRNRILAKLEKQPIFVKRLIAFIFALIAIAFLYICYKSIVFSHYIYLNKEPA